MSLTKFLCYRILLIFTFSLLWHLAFGAIEATRNIPINWQDGSPIIADGAAVHTFQASDAQYRDHNLFGARDIPTITPPYIAGSTLFNNSNTPTNILPQISRSRYGGQEQQHHQELVKNAGEHWKNRHLYDYQANLNRDYAGYTGTGEVRASYPILSLVGTGIGKASAWAGRKVLEKGLSRVTAKEARQVGGRGLAELGGKEGGKGVGALNNTVNFVEWKNVKQRVSEKVFNKANHVFGSQSLEKHNLSAVLEKFSGDQVRAFQSLEKAAQKLVGQGKIDGIFESVVKLKGFDVTVRGKVVDGTVKIGTAFIP